MLEAKALTKYYKGKSVLQDVSFSVSPGEVLGIIGPNGAGKSTLLRIISGILDADGGAVSTNGKVHGIAASGDWGYLPEERGLYLQMKVLDQLVHFAALKGMPVALATSKASRLLKEWKMDHYAQVKAGELSKGNQQRIQFLTTLLHDPALIILDEPFSGLDPVQADWLTEQMLQFRKQGKMILYSSHRMDSVEALCDRILVLHEGKATAYGSAHILCQQQEDIWQVILQGGDEHWCRLVNVVNRQQQRNDQYLVKFSLVTADLAAVVAAITQSGARLETIKRDRLSLHEVFVQLTSGSHVA